MCFDDDTKLENIVNTSKGCAAVQKDLDKFIKRKCKVLHLGRNNTLHLYMLQATQLESSFLKNGLQISSGHQIEHEPATCPCGK